MDICHEKNPVAAQDRTHEAKIERDLRNLRNNAVFLFFMLNFLWLFIIFLLQVRDSIIF